MQSTIGSERPARQGRVGAHHIAVIGCGIALAVAAAVVFAGFGDFGRTTVGEPDPVPAQDAVSRSGPEQLLVYLVSTEAEKRALEQDVWSAPEWFPETYSSSNAGVRIVVLEDGQEESLDVLARLLPEASIGTGSGPAIKLFDMR